MSGIDLFNTAWARSANWFSRAAARWSIPSVSRNLNREGPKALERSTSIQIGTCVQIDPRELVTRERLDVIVKYLFFRGLAGDLDRNQWEPVYRQHILDRTGGVEPPDLFRGEVSPKRSIDDYIRTCESLFQSVKSNGYDAAFAIPAFPTGKLLNGAHRLACALALQCPIIVESVRGDGSNWDFKWFVERRYPQEVLAQLLYHYARLSKRAVGVVILWGPMSHAWPRVTNELSSHVDVVGWLDTSFEHCPSAFESIVRDMYSLEWNELVQPNIRRKVILLNQSRRVFRIVLVEDAHNDRKAFLEKLREVRDAIRYDFGADVPNSAFCTCHASTTEEEARYLVELLFGQCNRNHQMWRSHGVPRPEFGQWLFQLANELSRYGLSRHDVCIVGSSPLEVVGIRNSTDIDITVASHFRPRFGPGVTHLSEWLDIVAETYARSGDRTPISDDQLICDARHYFWYRGFKFASTEIVLERKALQARAKDLADVDAAQRFFARESVGDEQYSAAHNCGAALISFLVDRERELQTGRI